MATIEELNAAAVEADRAWEPAVPGGVLALARRLIADMDDGWGLDDEEIMIALGSPMSFVSVCSEHLPDSIALCGTASFEDCDVEVYLLRGARYLLIHRWVETIGVTWYDDPVEARSDMERMPAYEGEIGLLENTEWHQPSRELAGTVPGRMTDGPVLPPVPDGETRELFAQDDGDGPWGLICVHRTPTGTHFGSWSPTRGWIDAPWLAGHFVWGEPGAVPIDDEGAERLACNNGLDYDDETLHKPLEGTPPRVCAPATSSS